MTNSAGPELDSQAVKRDAIVISPHWDWEAFNIPERNAIALSLLGCRVLYCAPVRSYLRRQNERTSEMPAGITKFVPRFFSDRANRLPGMRKAQNKWIAKQILNQASALGLRDPIFIYNHLAGQFSVAQEMKRRGLYLVHAAQDYPEPLLFEHAELSDKTLVIQKNVFHILRARFGDKVSLIPDAILNSQETVFPQDSSGSALGNIPRPRLGYLGSPQSRLNLRLIRQVLEAHPDWHFVYFGGDASLSLPNAHAVPWQAQRDLPSFVAALDVGFMPYDCSNPLSFHCLPLKRLDYFAFGIPVVSTSILNLWNDELVYLGDTKTEFERAVCRALNESPDDENRCRRREYAREHSIENLARRLREELPLS